MNVKVTNRVYTAKAFPAPELDKITVPNFSPPKGRFTAGVLRCCPGTLLIFPSGSVVITALPKDDLTPLDFRIDPTHAFIDLNRSYLQIQVQILHSDGSKIVTKIDDKGVITKQELVAPVNNIV